MDTILDPRELALHTIIKAAGAKALALFNDPDGLKISMKGAQDWLTHADGEVEAFIRAELHKLFPADSIMGEEEGGEDGAHLWIIDPIEGTANFARQDRLWCISVGFAVNGVPMLGAVFAPSLDEFYAARKGHGATMNGKRLRLIAVSWSWAGLTAALIALILILLRGPSITARLSNAARPAH